MQKDLSVYGVFYQQNTSTQGEKMKLIVNRLELIAKLQEKQKEIEATIKEKEATIPNLVAKYKEQVAEDIKKWQAYVDEFQTVKTSAELQQFNSGYGYQPTARLPYLEIRREEGDLAAIKSLIRKLQVSQGETVETHDHDDYLSYL